MASDFKVKIKGLDRLNSNMAAVAKKYPAAASQVLFEDGERMKTIIAPLIPVDFGTLQGSLFVNKPTRSPRGLRLTVGVGGAAKAYALAVHERTEVSHEVGGAKYMERGVQMHRRGMLRRMRDNLAAKVARIQLRT